LGFSVASALKPDVLLLDEVLTVGDANFQAKCFQRIGNMLAQSAVILVSHNPHHIKKLCDRVFLLQRGNIIETGSADYILSLYARMHDARVNESLVLLDPKVRSATIENFTETISSGGFLDFDFILDSLATVKCDQCYLNLVDRSDLVHAHVNLTGLAKFYGPGESRHRVRVGPLHLTSGLYSGNFMLYGDGGKSTIAHLRHSLGFRFDGPPSLGPVYHPPSSVAEVSISGEAKERVLA
jgi:ABC-type glutathione transport system ATPase component